MLVGRAVAKTVVHSTEPVIAHLGQLLLKSPKLLNASRLEKLLQRAPELTSELHNHGTCLVCQRVDLVFLCSIEGPAATHCCAGRV